ncbi:MAG TPA: tyrosine-type recombinase/integrase [bacterium]|nr:tyrosine-type recombinase/integrase [bacterium]
MDVDRIGGGEVSLVTDALVRTNRAASKANETKRALLKNWALFERWCSSTGDQALPATPETVERFLLYLSDQHPVRDRKGQELRRGLKASAVAQALWALNARHRMAGLPAPGESALVKTALSGIRRRKATRPKQQAPLTIEHLRAVRFRDDLKGRRDKALLLVGFAGCLRRSELVALHVEHLEETPLGLRIYLPRSKTDQEGAGAWVDLLRAAQYPELCPVEALLEWLAAARIAAGPVFRSLGKGRHPRIAEHLSAASVDAIVKWAAGACGLDPHRYGGHSLRAGQATYLSEHGKSPAVIARHGRWKSLNMVLTYCRSETARELVGVY